MNTVKKVLSKICNIASTIVVVLVVILAFALVGVRLIVNEPTDDQLDDANAKTIKVKAFAVQSANTEGHADAWGSAFPASND